MRNATFNRVQTRFAGETCDLNIAKAVIGKMRLVKFYAITFKSVVISLYGSSKVLGIYIFSPRNKRLGKSHSNG